jgi:hypothetical protein
MRKGRRQESGFSLTEVLLAVGTLAVGMIFIAGAFPVGIHFTTVATERTIAAVVADEAFAKVRMIAAGPHPDAPDLPLISDANFAFGESRSFRVVANDILMEGLPTLLPENVFGYPSLDEVGPEEKSYFWSAICRRTRPDGEPTSDVQVTVFVCRKVGVAQSYWFRNPNDDVLSEDSYPRAIYFKVSKENATELEILDEWPIDDGIDDERLINEGYMIVDDERGDIYRVVARDTVDTAKILLDRPWEGLDVQRVWAIPAVSGGGRYPCIAVYQKVIRF